MSLEELIQRQQQGKNFIKKLPLSQEIKRSIYLLVCTLLGLIILLSIVFLLNTSQSNQKGYILKKQQLDKETFMLKNRELIDKIIKAQASKTIENNPIVKQMQPPQNQVYLNPPKQ